MIDDDALKKIRFNAGFAVEKFGELTDFEFGLNRKSVEWIEGFIERQRVREGDHYNMIGVLGSFLGEAIIATAGGEWTASGETFSIAFKNEETVDWCFPFAKVAKQFENGVEGGDGILSFYDIAVDLVSTGRL